MHEEPNDINILKVECKLESIEAHWRWSMGIES